MGRPGDRVVPPPGGRRGRSGLHRARWWPTATRGNPRDSATENRPPPGAGTASGGGKGETVVQETTSGPGDRTGSVNPTWSKVKKSARLSGAPDARAFEGCPPEHAGGPLEAAGNGRPRWMVAPLRRNRTRPTGQARSAHWSGSDPAEWATGPRPSSPRPARRHLAPPSRRPPRWRLLAASSRISSCRRPVPSDMAVSRPG